MGYEMMGSFLNFFSFEFKFVYGYDLTPPEMIGIMSRMDDGLLVSPNSGRSSASHNLSFNQL
jgi:hypothetical protein